MAKKVLFIDPDAFLVRFYKVKLEKKNYSVAFLEDGEFVNEAIQNERPDIIVLEILLPDRDGFDVIRKLKQDSDTSSIPIIIFTQLAHESDRQMAMDLGCASYIVKMDQKIDDIITEIDSLS